MSSQTISVSVSSRFDVPADRARLQILDPTAAGAPAITPASDPGITVIHFDDHGVLYNRSSSVFGFERSDDILLWTNEDGDFVHDYVAGDHVGAQLVHSFQELADNETLVTATLTLPTNRRTRLANEVKRWFATRQMKRELDGRSRRSSRSRR